MSHRVPQPRHGFLRCNEVAPAIAADRTDLAQATSRFPHRYVALSNLAISVYSRYRCTAKLADLDAVIAHQREAVSCVPAGHPERDSAEANLALLPARMRNPCHFQRRNPDRMANR